VKSVSEKHIYIVLLNYKNWQDTIASAESILKSDYRNFRLIIVDNASPNDSMSSLKKWAAGTINSWTPPDHPLRSLSYPPVPKPLDAAIVEENEIENTPHLPKNRVVLIQARQNLGYSAGNNIAIAFAKRCGDFDAIWILNNDTLITPQTLKKLISCSNTTQHEKVLLGTTLLFYDAPETIQAHGGVFNPLLAVPAHNLPHAPFEVRNSAKRKEIKIDYLIGASMLLSKTVIEHIKKMPEEYFLYFEEIDIATNCKRSGFRIAICDEAIVYHKESASIDAEDRHKSAFSDFFALRNRLLFTRKYYPLFLPPVYMGLLLSLALRIWRRDKSGIYNILRILSTMPGNMHKLTYKPLPDSLFFHKTL